MKNHTHKILYVDDEESNLRIFQAHFNWEYEVLTANSAQKGLELLKAHDIQLLITDQRMPDMTGIELLRVVRPLYPDTMFIILTGYAELEVITEAVNECGIYKFISKPYNIDQFKLTIRNALHTYDLKRDNNRLLSELKRYNHQLEDIIAERTKEIEIQKDELKFQKENIEIQNEELGRAFGIIRMKNKEITDSINYANTIQQAILPHEEDLTDLFKDHFVTFLPKDIVSGDFFWATEIKKQNQRYVAVVDCTGHGVPGAFMSMIGNILLNKIIKENGVLSTGEAVSLLHEEIITVLKQDQTHREDVNNDGMDLALCMFQSLSDGSFKVEFSGAKRPLAFYNPNIDELTLVKGDRLSVGGNRNRSNKVQFSTHKLLLPKGSIFYLWSDGLTDQNDKLRKKFSMKRLYQLFERIKKLPLSEQKIQFQKEFNTFKENQKQRDDITFLAIKI